MPEPTTTPLAPNTPATPAAPTTPAPEPENKDIADAARDDSAIAAMLSSSSRKKKKDKEAAEKAAPAKPVEEPAPAPAPAPVAATTEPAAAPEKPVKVRKPRPPEPAPGLTADEIGRAVGEAVRNVIPKPADPSAVELPEELQHKAPVYAELKKINPKKYANVEKQVAAYFEKEKAYVNSWIDDEIARLKAAGQFTGEQPEFNPNDPQHRAFYSRNEHPIDPEDEDAAKIEMRVNKAFEERYGSKLKDAEAKMARLEAEPAARAAVDHFSNTLLSKLNDGKIDPDSFKEWTAKNPIESELAQREYAQLQPVVHAASMLWDGAIAKLDPQDKAQVEAARLFNELEQKLINLDEPFEQNGKIWVPFHKWLDMPPEKQAKVFTTTKQSLIAYIGLETADRVKQMATDRTKLAEEYAAKMGWQKPAASPVTHQPPAATPSKPAPALVSPSLSGGGSPTATVGAAPTPKAEPTDHIGRMLGKR